MLRNQELKEALEIACLDAMGGDPPSRLLASRLERECKIVLIKYGLDRAQVRATSDRTGTKVHIRLPQPDNTVREVVLTVD